MKKILLLSYVCLLFFSCSKDSSSPEVVKDDIKPPFIVKYELTFSSGLEDKRGTTRIKYGSEYQPGKYAINNSVYIYGLPNTWVHTFTSTVAENPLFLVVNTDIEPVNAGSVNFKIFVNNIMVANQTIAVIPRTNISIPTFFGTSYWVN
jgi:hypothetical protein